MAGKYYRNRIGTVSGTHGARKVHISESASQLAIRAGFSIRDGVQLCPYPLLKCCSAHVKFHRETLQFAREIGTEFLYSPVKWSTGGLAL